ncbi:hypothetical protein GCM10023149_37770 [Mucilaginibacter gynuensis]|uniref:Plasmid transfer protein n=1 Tax=Mucilaginibacter gynuensis TaxID=1302236 RepID=A0ABP8GYW7_9SPHI
MKFLLLLFGLLSTSYVNAQQLVFDPVVSTAIAVNANAINNQLNTTNNKLTLIQKGQLAVSGQLAIVNNLQNRLLSGLSQVAAVINNLSSVKEIGACGLDIVKDIEIAVRLARTNPALLLFAEQFARDFQQRATRLTAEVGAYVLKGGNENLMDAGERGKLLNHIVQELRILRGIAYGLHRAMYWAGINGILKELNPWAEWQNADVRIANEILNKAQYLKP